MTNELTAVQELGQVTVQLQDAYADAVSPELEDNEIMGKVAEFAAKTRYAELMLEVHDKEIDPVTLEWKHLGSRIDVDFKRDENGWRGEGWNEAVTEARKQAYEQYGALTALFHLDTWIDAH